MVVVMRRLHGVKNSFSLAGPGGEMLEQKSAPWGSSVTHCLHPYPTPVWQLMAKGRKEDSGSLSSSQVGS